MSFVCGSRISEFMEFSKLSFPEKFWGVFLLSYGTVAQFLAWNLLEAKIFRLSGRNEQNCSLKYRRKVPVCMKGDRGPRNPSDEICLQNTLTRTAGWNVACGKIWRDARTCGPEGKMDKEAEKMKMKQKEMEGVKGNEATAENEVAECRVEKMGPGFGPTALNFTQRFFGTRNNVIEQMTGISTLSLPSEIPRHPIIMLRFYNLWVYGFFDRIIARYAVWETSRRVRLVMRKPFQFWVYFWNFGLAPNPTPRGKNWCLFRNTPFLLTL